MKQINKIYIGLFITVMYLIISYLVAKKNNFNTHVVNALCFGYLINLLDNVFSIGLTKFFEIINSKSLMVAILGKMVIRMIFFLILVFIFALFFEIDKLIFVLSLFILYFVILTIKLSLIHLRNKLV